MNVTSESSCQIFCGVEQSAVCGALTQYLSLNSFYPPKIIRTWLVCHFECTINHFTSLAFITWQNSQDGVVCSILTNLILNTHGNRNWNWNWERPESFYEEEEEVEDEDEEEKKTPKISNSCQLAKYKQLYVERKHIEQGFCLLPLTHFRTTSSWNRFKRFLCANLLFSSCNHNKLHISTKSTAYRSCFFDTKVSDERNKKEINVLLI